MKYTIDAKKKKLGRVATEAASLLMGKNTSTFTRNKIPAGIAVEIINVSQAEISQKKLKETEYAKYSGYPGGLRYESIENVISKKGYAEIFRRAVYGMLPSNKLRPIMIKKLTIKE